jgi:hypothetical protein
MSKLTERLASQLGVRMRMQAGLRLIALEDCERIVEACKADGFLILGIEAFRLTEVNIVPDTDLIADFSELISMRWDEACVEAARSAKSYFGEAKGRTDLWFDFRLRQLE